MTTSGYVLRTSCLRCGGDLVPWHHWALCPVCDPLYAEVFPPLPVPVLQGVGRPTVSSHP